MNAVLAHHDRMNAVTTNPDQQAPLRNKSVYLLYPDHENASRENPLDRGRRPFYSPPAMNTSRRIVAVLVSVILPTWAAFLAAQPGADRPTGRVLVLAENERTLEGDIEQVGGQYRIRRGM